MTGIKSTRPISKNIGRPIMAPTNAIAHGSARGDARPMMVSTISSAPPESASSLANIAPRAIRMPTLAAVSPNPLPNESRTSPGFCPATMPTVKAPNQGQERVQLRHGDQHDDQRDTGSRCKDQLPACGNGFDQLGVGRQDRDGRPDF